MIKLFQSTDTAFESNGDIVLKPLKAKIHKEDNGDYYLNLETGLEYSEYIKEGNIVCVDAPQGQQAFRITNPIKNKSKIQTKAWHITYDSKNLLIADSYVVDKNCSEALAHLNDATDISSPFETYSNIATRNSFRCIRKSLYEAIQTVIDRWGGHLVRDNFLIGVMASIGSDNGVTVRYKKNLKDISCTENWDNVVTKLLPVGKDGILLNALDSSVDKYVYSSINYEIPYTKALNFEQSIDEEEFTVDGVLDETAYKQALIEDLRTQANAYIETNNVPQVNYTLKANLEKITDIGDVVEVIDERLGIDLMTNVIAFEYDCILGKYTQIEFGNFKNKLSDLVSTVTASATAGITEQVTLATDILNAEIQRATEDIWSALGDSYVVYDGDKILILDYLPKESAINVIRLNNEGISISNSGINGTFVPVWSIDGEFNMHSIDIVNLTADLIKGGTYKVGSHDNINGSLEIYSDANIKVATLDKDGLKAVANNGAYLLINRNVGFAGFDKNNNPLFWTENNAFHMKKSAISEEIIMCNKVKCLPIQVSNNNVVINDGIGFFGIGG